MILLLQVTASQKTLDLLLVQIRHALALLGVVIEDILISIVAFRVVVSGRMSPQLIFTTAFLQLAPRGETARI